MSLLLEALKKAEKAKEDAQRRARESDSSGELQLAAEAPAGDTRHVVTRDELPQITAPLEILSEDLGADPAKSGARDPSLQDAPAAAAARGGDAQAAQRGTARKVFEAKVREPNPQLPFYIALGVLGAFGVGTVIYFWMQLRTPSPLYNTNPPPPSGEVQATVAPRTPPPDSTPVGTIPGLPPVSRPAAKPTPVAAAAPPAAQQPRPAPATPRVSAPRPRSAAAASSLVTSRPPPRVHPGVASGYAAYQAGDMERARANYDQALRDEPGNRDALLGLAAVETRALRFTTAEALYRRLLLAAPRDPFAHAGLLSLRAQRIDPVAAESRVKGLLAVDPEESVLHFSLGNQFAQQGRWAEARQAYGKAAAMDPDNPDYAYNLAVSLEHMREPQPALRQYRRALALALQRTASFDASAALSRVQQLER
ncbi:MAG: tetratricopeptide repeat protein [Betaproteobacteria bacterium]|nr:tetratricopeptide repeat protein [Betaproteobacteria bacterium]